LDIDVDLLGSSSASIGRYEIEPHVLSRLL
jgi:hypothetical protein